MLQLLTEMVAGAPTVSSVQHSNYEFQPSMRTKQKRHNSLQEVLQHEMHTPFRADWSNPCGGLWLGTNRTDYLKKRRMKKTLRIVKNIALREYRTLALTTSAINISDIHNWELYKQNYTFLSTSKVESNFTLRNWHRQLQVYAAAFGYLRRVSLHSDQREFMYETDVSKVLLQFKQSARNILCEIESAINATTTHGRHQHRAVTSTKPQVMLKRFKFQTHFKGRINAKNGLIEFDAADKLQINAIDLKFIKQRYFILLRGIVNTLKRHKIHQKEVKNIHKVAKKPRIKFLWHA